MICLGEDEEKGGSKQQEDEEGEISKTTARHGRSMKLETGGQ